jgi:predicted pyridoxine 5'-phosphate oxidase superfamily flavin-nucleotide-binding protein
VKIRYTNDDGTFRELSDVFEDQHRQMDQTMTLVFIGVIVTGTLFFAFVVTGFK